MHTLPIDRRAFLERAARVGSAAAMWPGFLTAGGVAAEEPAAVEVGAMDGCELQKELLKHAGSGRSVRLRAGRTLVCKVREDIIEGEKSTHGLLVPPGVALDLAGGTLQLDLQSNSYGVRLCSDSAIRNGTIRIVRSEGKGSQACWHSGISIGAAYGDGGTTDRPGKFSRVAHWLIEDITIDQPFTAAAIQLMSEACFGTIRSVQIRDSKQALLGVGLDWGSVGPITSEDAQIPRMRELWERGEIYSTHPHDIAIEKLRVGKLLRNVDGNDAGVRCSACHRITIRDIEVDTAATAVAIFGGDCGYEYAVGEQRENQHQGYVIENVRIADARRYGIVLNGAADNVWRATRSHGYVPLRDPVHPGIDRPLLRDIDLSCAGAVNSQGVYAVAVAGATIERLQARGFEIGVHVEDWVRGMAFRDCRLEGNKRETAVEGATEPARDVTFLP